jgi:predicted kinase
VELVILMGLQASGKSTFRRSEYDATHVIVSKDHFRNNRRPSRRQARLIEEALKEGRSVVVDNTNPTKQERALLIAQGSSHGARIKGYFFASSVQECLLRNQKREGKDRIPEIGIYSVAKILERPSKMEGFDELFFVKLDAKSGFKVESYVEPDEE